MGDSQKLRSETKPKYFDLQPNQFGISRAKFFLALKEAGNELSSRYFDKKKRDAIVNFCKQRNSNFISDKMHETAFNGYIVNI